MPVLQIVTQTYNSPSRLTSLPCRFQLRCVLMQPLLLAAGQAVRGSLRCTAHNQQSYDLHLTLTAPPLTPGGPPQQVL